MKLLIVCLSLYAQLAAADANLMPPAEIIKPKISIVIDDLGDNSVIARKMLSLPAQMTAAILPHTPHAELISNFAKARGHQVIMHLPMEAFTRTDLLGPGALLANMAKPELQQTILSSGSSVPNIIGFNNHMGSLLTEDYQKMHWVMESAKQQGWFFLDSKTSETSVAQKVAQEIGIASIGRDLFLDHKGGTNGERPPSMSRQFQRMRNIARKRGQVVIICHPYPETLAFLTEHLSELQQDFDLVGLTTLIEQTEKITKIAKLHKK